MDRFRSNDRLLAALRKRGAHVRAVRYRENRTVLLSVSADGGTLNTHTCFQDAPPRVVDAIAAFVRSQPGTPTFQRALRVINEWEGAQKGLARARRRRPPRPRSEGTPEQDAQVRRLYDQLNRRHFRGQLPDVPLRISRRMTRSLGTIAYGNGREGRQVREIAISADLLRAMNRRMLHDTLLHEMSHAEAWLVHGHQGHGGIWRRIAERVGCTPRALIYARIYGR